MAGRTFEDDVLRVLRGLPAGSVMTYGEVALEAGHPGAARAVGSLLARGGHDLPWWRVVNRSGRLVPGQEEEHRRLLRAEGVPVIDGHVSMPAVSPASPTRPTRPTRTTRMTRST